MLFLHFMLASIVAAGHAADARPEPLGNVRVTVTFRWQAVDDRAGIAVRPRRGSIGVTGDARRSQSSATTRQQLLVMSGGRAPIRIAEEVPYSEWFWTWGLGRGLWTESVRWRDVGTGMEVSPVVLPGRRIRVTLTPYFEYFLDTRRQTTQVHELATEVIVREGEEIDVGGVPWSDTEFRERFLIGYDRARGTSQATITLRAAVE
jgi:hypothetical protein